MSTFALGSRPTILIVEDEQVVATDLEQTLRELGYGVAGIADTGQAALKLVAQDRPDLIVMDIYLQGNLDGIAVAEEINKRWHIPFVFVTANTDDQMALRARATGPHGYLIKPFRTQELDATILIAWSQYQRANELFSRYEWLKTVLENLNDGVIAVDAGGQIRYMNAVAEQLTGWTSSDALGKCVDQVLVLFSLAGEPVQACPTKMTLSSVQPAGKQRFLLQTKNGRRVPIEDSAAPIIGNGCPIGAVSLFYDVSDHLRREREAEELKDQLEEQVQLTAAALGQTRSELRALSAHLMSAQEEERRRVAQELHDDLSQRSAAIEIRAMQALGLVRADNADLKRVLQTIREQVSELGEGLRTVSHRLHPSVLIHIGLVSALKSLAQDFQDAGGEVSVCLPEISPDIPLDASTTLYRIAQEALRNVAKHAPGAPARITLESTSRAVHLTIEDAGPGFNLENARARGGLGLLSMQERARTSGGNLFISTLPGKGTTLKVHIPQEAVRANH